MAANKFTIYPILGLNTAVPEDDISLFVPRGDGFATYDTGGQNYDLTRSKNSCVKAMGYEAITNAVASPSSCPAIFSVEWTAVRGERARAMLDNTVAYGFATQYTKDTPTAINGAGHTFTTNGTLGISAIEFAGYLVFTDGVVTPVKWDGDESNDLTDLIVPPATQYVFRYLESFQQRIFGAFTTETSGEMSVRWTNALPAYASLSFPDANQLYKPGTDHITGIKKLGASACVLYGSQSINEIVYYPSSYLRPFGIIPIMHEHGPTDARSIVATPEAHYFYARDYGFVRYAGGQNYEVISTEIQDMVDGILYSQETKIMGAHVRPNRVAWLVPLSGATSFNAVLEYNIERQTWTKTVPAITPTCMASMQAVKIGASDNNQLTDHLVFGTTTGIIYCENENLNDFATSNIDGYRIEPIMDFGSPFEQKLLTEIRFGIVQGGDYSLDVSWRGGDTAKEVLAASWTALPSLSLNSPAAPAIFPGQMARLHQIKWGTNLKDEKFEVNRIDLIWSPAGI